MPIPLEVRLPNGEITKNVPRIVDFRTIHTTADTILDPKHEKEGFTISLPAPVETPFGDMQHISVPACPRSMIGNVITIDDLAMRANNILRVVELFTKGEKEYTVVGKSVNAYLNAVLKKICNKNGIVAKDLLGRRVKMTGRAVLVPSTDKNVHIAKLPFKMMKRLKLQDGDLVIIGRDPTIWHGSLDIFQAQGNHEDVIHIHPFCFSQFGADCDGDTLWVMAIPKADDCNLEARQSLIGFAKDSVKDFKKATTGDEPGPANWEDPKSHFRTNGFSISPEDILSNPDKTGRFAKATGKNVANEAKAIAENIDRANYENYITTVNRAMLVQKVYLGPIGAASNKLKLIAGSNRLLLDSACYISERAQQSLFDYKGTAKSDNDTFDVFEILAIMNMSGTYKTTYTKVVSYTTVIDRLGKNGLDPAKCQPIIAYTYAIYPLTKASKTILGRSPNQEETDLLMQLCDYEGMKQYPSNIVFLDKLCDLTGMDRKTLIAEFVNEKTRITLGNILNDPIYNVINPTQKLIENITQVTSMVLFDKHINSFTGSIVKQALEKEDAKQ